MIYTLPRHPNMDNILPPFPTEEEIARLLQRLRERAIAAGYVIGAGGVQIGPQGEILIDADRDPTNDWLAFDPGVKTNTENTEDTEIAQAITLVPRLLAGTATNAQAQKVLGRLLREYLRRLGHDV